ncbi:ubiquitin carboxyl-terminal hydrolase [Hamiltosporidium tvaerminnensis]|uniref:Ubiquitin carboxyl-terminal hydrolase n=1 Tax=Hamiltosporidium tvaerminnensis TaxID=1176355 RepID=A0A4Q9L0M4_9MICR|nr:hypothetical protein LUQ84_000861 [Hamiltosporidium tvaerminnensis]TBU00883.1 ubiquitin carboxyl-terminal hydrolase [Hamiltosporidium tvaerminnensis]
MSKKICEHLSFDNFKKIEPKITEIYYKFINNINLKEKHINIGCSNCESKFYIHICLNCLTTSCFKNKHYILHLNENNHEFSFNIEKCLIYCIKCNKYNSINELSSLKCRKNTEILKSIRSYVNYKKIPELCVKGIQNHGNTCYINSILQIFINSRKIQNIFFSLEHQTKLCKMKNCLYCSIKIVLNDLFSNSKYTINITNFIYNLWKNENILIGNKQYDAHDFYLTLCQNLHSKNSNENFDSKNCNCMIHRMFFGTFISSLECQKCKNISSKIESFLSISLEMKNEHEIGIKDLKAAINNFLTAEPLTDEVSCLVCAIKTPAIKNVKIQSLPEILCFHIKRFRIFNKTPIKIEENINYPEFITLNNINYEIYGIVRHIGNLENGHFVSYIRLNKKWYKFDDECITCITYLEAMKIQAFLIFYSKV